MAALALNHLGAFGTKKEAKANIKSAVTAVSKVLRNTPAICRKCYVHPAVFKTYLSGAAIEGLSFVYRVPDESGEGRDRLYCLRHGVIRGEAAPPTTPIERAAFAETARRLSLDTGPAPAAHNGAEMAQLLLVMSWFRRNPEEYEHTSPFRRWITEAF